MRSRDLLEDSNFLSAVHKVVEEPVPYFQQFSTLRELGGKRGLSAHAHASVAGPHEPLLDTPPDTLTRPSLSLPTLNSQLELSNTEDIIQGDNREDIVPRSDPNEAQLNRHIKLYVCNAFFIEDLCNVVHFFPYRIPEFSSFVENILENTLLNILKEANSGELNIGGPLYLIAKPPPSLSNSPITA